MRCPLESRNATDTQPDGETFSKEEPGARLPTQPLLISIVYYQHYRAQLRECSPSHPPARRRAVSAAEGSPTFFYVGIFQDRFALESCEGLVSEIGAWSPPLRVLVSRTQVGVWASIAAARISDDHLVCANERLSSDGRHRVQGGSEWPWVGGKDPRLKQLFQRTNVSIINCS